MKAFLQMKLPPQSRKKGSTNEQLHLLAKDEKGYLVLSIGSCGDKTEKNKKSLKDELALFFSFYFEKFADFRNAGTVH